jgi:hypothetical protein
MGWVSDGDRQKLLEMAVHDNGIEEVGGSIPPGSTSVFQGLRLKTLLIFRIGILISYNSEKGIYAQGPSYRDLIASGVRLRTK